MDLLIFSAIDTHALLLKKTPKIPEFVNFYGFDLNGGAFSQNAQFHGTCRMYDFRNFRIIFICLISLNLGCRSHLSFIFPQQTGKTKRRQDESKRSGINGEVGIKRRRRSQDCPS